MLKKNIDHNFIYICSMLFTQALCEQMFWGNSVIFILTFEYGRGYTCNSTFSADPQQQILLKSIKDSRIYHEGCAIAQATSSHHKDPSSILGNFM
jgi:hypothetical protein